MAKEKAVGVLTGGGCAPGLDPFLEGFVRRICPEGYEVKGIKYGWEGLLCGGCEFVRPNPEYVVLDQSNVSGLVRSGGTIIGTSRANPFAKDFSAENEQALDQIMNMNIDGLVAAGGDDTLGVANKLHSYGIKIIGVPKTMDLDLNGTDYSVGFWAYNEAVFRNALPPFIDTLRAHHRVGVLEVFGRHSGFTAVVAGIAGGACYIGIPEIDVDIDAIAARIAETYQRERWALVVIGEGIKIEGSDVAKLDPHANELIFQKRVGEAIAKQIEEMTGIETRAFQATHPYRGVPSAYDAVFGFRIGVKAAEMVLRKNWGKMVASQGDHLVELPLSAYKPRRVIAPGSWWYEITQARNSGQY